MTDTLVLALAVVSVVGALVTLKAVPRTGMTVSLTELPTVTPVVTNVTVTGLVKFAGNDTSPSPLGCAGTGSPPILAIAKVGKLGTEIRLV